MVVFVIFKHYGTTTHSRSLEATFFDYAKAWSNYVDEWLVIDDGWHFTRTLPRLRVIREPNTPDYIHQLRHFPVNQEVLRLHPDTLIYDPNVVRQCKEGPHDLVYSPDRSLVYTRHSRKTWKLNYQNANNPHLIVPDRPRLFFNGTFSETPDYNGSKTAYFTIGQVYLPLELLSRIKVSQDALREYAHKIDKKTALERLMWLYWMVGNHQPELLGDFLPILELSGLSLPRWERYLRQFIKHHQH
jgi:hypothetical protein